MINFSKNRRLTANLRLAGLPASNSLDSAAVRLNNPSEEEEGDLA